MHSRDDACAAEPSIETAGWGAISSHCTAEMLVLWKLASKLLKCKPLSFSRVGTAELPTATALHQDKTLQDIQMLSQQVTHTSTTPAWHFALTTGAAASLATGDCCCFQHCPKLPWGRSEQQACSTLKEQR